MPTRVPRNPDKAHRCPRCHAVRTASRGPRVYPWTRLHCSACDVWWWRGGIRWGNPLYVGSKLHSLRAWLRRLTR